MNKIFAAVLRLSGEELSQSGLDEKLGWAVDRIDKDKRCARKNIAEGDSEDWREINAQLESLGPGIQAALRDGILGRVVLDIAYDYPDYIAYISRTIPAQSAALAGGFGIDIMVSVYRKSE